VAQHSTTLHKLNKGYLNRPDRVFGEIIEGITNQVSFEGMPIKLDIVAIPVSEFSIKVKIVNH